MTREQDSVSQRLQRFQRDIDYYEGHREELLDRYPEQWVAIFNEQVAGTDYDAERLLAQLEEQGTPLDRALIKRLTTKEELFIL